MTRHFKQLFCVWGAAALLATAWPEPLLAQVTTLRNAKPWAALTASERDALAPLEREWPGIDAVRQQKWLDVASRFNKLEPDDRARMQQRMGDWARMTPDERRRARLNYQELRTQTAPDERQSRWQTYQALPESQKRELAKRAAEAPAVVAPAVKQRRVDGTKSTVVTAPLPVSAAAKPANPSLVRACLGTTTTLVSQPVKPPMHQQTGLPKMTAKPGFVDPQTLLPKRGMQGAAIASQAEKSDNIKRQ